MTGMNTEHIAQGTGHRAQGTGQQIDRLRSFLQQHEKRRFPGDVEGIEELLLVQNRNDAIVIRLIQTVGEHRFRFKLSISANNQILLESGSRHGETFDANSELIEEQQRCMINTILHQTLSKYEDLETEGS